MSQACSMYRFPPQDDINIFPTKHPFLIAFSSSLVLHWIWKQLGGHFAILVARNYHVRNLSESSLATLVLRDN